MSLETALDLHRHGELDAAERAYRAHLAEAPDDADALYLLGVLRQQRGAGDEAETLLRQAIARAPDVARYHLALGGVHMHRGVEAALALDPNCAEAHGALGHLAFLGGDTAAAEQRFRIGRRVEEDDPLILLGLGNVHLARNDPANAAKFLTRAAERRPDDAAIQTSLGRAYFEQGAFAFAEQAFANALRLRPELSLARLYLARAKLRQGKLEEARAGFAALAEAGTQPFGAYAGLGDVARQQGQVVKALKFYRRALALDPAHPGAINACAWCMEWLGDLAGAAQYLATGLEHAPHADELRRPLAELLERLGRSDEAARVRGVPGA